MSNISFRSSARLSSVTLFSLSVTALASVLALSVSAVHAQDVQVVKIAHVAPMSGGIAHIGKDMENGVRLAIEELNTENLTIGGKKIRFELQGEDDAGDPRQATAIAQKLCDAKVSAVVGHLQSGTSIPASSIYHKCGLPHISAGATNPDLTKPAYNTTYRVIANDGALGAAVAVHAADALKIKRVAVVDDRTAYGQGLASVFKATAKQKGIEIIAEEFTTDKATDFMAILTSIKSKKPDAIFYGGLDSQAGPMLRQMEQLGLGQVRMFGGDAICTEKLPELSAKAAPLMQVVCATGGSALEKLPNGLNWKKKYDERFPGQFQIYSPYTYDATRVFVNAMKTADSVKPSKYIPALQKSHYKGITADISFNKSGDLTAPAITLYTYKEGVRTPLN